MNRGDYVLGYHHKAFYYVCRVLETFHHPALATNIWGVDEKTGKTWAEVNISVSEEIALAAPPGPL